MTPTATGTGLSASAPLDTGPEAPAGSRTPGAARLAVSFEIMPPRSRTQQERSPELLELLSSYDPDYVAVTSAVGTGWSAGTAAFIEQLAATTRLRPLAHLTCTAAPRPELTDWIERFLDAGVRGFLAVRGDLAPGQQRTPAGHLAHADELVALLRAIERRHVARLCAGRLAIGVAAYPSGHPESRDAEEDIDVLASKQRNGADFAITQLFFDPADVTRLQQRTRLAGISLPIIPGIMPITGMRRLQRMCQLSGLTPPARITAALAEAGSPAAEYDIGLDLTAGLVDDLIAAGVPGLHFYTFNDPATITDLMARLRPATAARLRTT